MSDTPTSLAILLWSADLTQPERLATPFVMAQAASALDLSVELYFSAQCVQLLTPAAAAVRIGFGDEQLPLSDYLQRCHDLSIKLYACGQALRGAGVRQEDLSPLCSGVGGSVQFMARCADSRWRTLVF